MTNTTLWGRAVMVGLVAGLLAGCGASSQNPLDPSASASSAASGGTVTTSASGASIRLRCEVRPGRSKISADGRNLRSGTYSARVQAAGGSATAGARQAIGGEVEFDFDSDRGDIAAGATAIAADFIVPRAGADVSADILDANGAVIVSGSAECEVR